MPLERAYNSPSFPFFHLRVVTILVTGSAARGWPIRRAAGSALSHWTVCRALAGSVIMSMAASLQFDPPRSPRRPYSRLAPGGPQLLSDGRASDSVSLVHFYGAAGRLSLLDTSSTALRLTPRLGDFRRDSGAVLQTASSLARSRVIIPPSSMWTCADAHALDVPPRGVLRSSLPTSFAGITPAARLDLATSTRPCTRRPSPWGGAVTQTGRPVALPELRRVCVTRSYDANRDHPSNPSARPATRHEQLGKSRQGMDLCRVHSLGMATRTS